MIFLHIDSNDKTETNWLLLNYTDGKDSVHVAGTGSGGLEELKQHLKPDHAQFGFVRHGNTFR
jgi:hypothetical protein